MNRIVRVQAAIQAAQTASVRIAGELTFESVAQARAQLIALVHAGCRHLVIDIEQLEFCDSSGLGMLLQLRSELIEIGGRLELRGGQGQPQRILEITGASRLFVAAGAKWSGGSPGRVPVSNRDTVAGDRM